MEFTPSPQVAVPASSSVPMVSVSPPLHDAMDTGHALMEVMRGTAVGCTGIFCLYTFSFSKLSMSVRAHYR